MTQLLSDLPIGSKIKYGTYKVENSSVEPIIWRIVDKNHAGYPDDSVTLLTDRIIDFRGFDAKEPGNGSSGRVEYGNNRYRTSNLRQWLNSNGAANSWWSAQNLTGGTANTNNHDAQPDNLGMNGEPTGYSDIPGFLNNFTADELSKILDTSITVAKNTITDGGGSETVIDKIFLLSCTEVGLPNENGIAEGGILAEFSNNASRVAYPTYQVWSNTLTSNRASVSSSAWHWWLRTPRATESGYERGIYTDGSLNSFWCITSYGIRPAMNLASDIMVSDLPDENGIYSMVWEVSLNLRTTEIGQEMNDTVLTTTSPSISSDGFSGGRDDALDVLKMLPQFFDPFKHLDLRLNVPKIGKATIKGAVEDSTTVITGKTDKHLEVGDRLWTGIENEILDLNGNFSEHIVVDATVINSAHSTEGNGGRRFVNLANGWLVAVTYNATDKKYHYRVSKNGAPFEDLCQYSHPQNTGRISIVPRGNSIYSLLAFPTQIVNLHFDATTVSNIDLSTVSTSVGKYGTANADTGQTETGNVALGINETSTELHACWSSKNSTYPNSFNIRYAKGTINQDGSVTWGSTEQITKYNTATYNIFAGKPSILLDGNGIPIVLIEQPEISFDGGTSVRAASAIAAMKRDSGFSTNTYLNSPWTYSLVYYSPSPYVQATPSAIYVSSGINGLPDGRIWVAWSGTDATYTVGGCLRIAYSDDGGQTWSTMERLTTGNSSGRYPTITVNKDNEIHIVFVAATTNNYGIKSIKNVDGVWGPITQIENDTSDGSTSGHPSAIFDPSMTFTVPLFIYTHEKEAKVGFYGAWTVGEGYTLEMQNPCTLTDGQQVPIVDLQVSQRNTQIPLHSIESNQINYRLETNDVVVDLTVEGKETELSSLAYAIS
ncbi:DUF6273 domain-containing protein [Desulfitobacterium chlororespirans]|uniref:DUF6273 domain-containing protein n=1 Tax=Desulfitobacterium chlororespirans DSM 11544 TaxID=1121395 RepID=A0A1M7U2H7_9FIRM|nr:DUF6273 domain-containing protein [Desulfitobacterium chlororespirans]SHN77158.1 hypothetical protein SAMN02745215_02849 [Desulfitobacterium chlororespirans DSM 11544]